MDAQLASAYEQHGSFVKRTLCRFGVTYSDADLSPHGVHALACGRTSRFFLPLATASLCIARSTGGAWPIAAE
jgi:hypothetical protein